MRRADDVAEGVLFTAGAYVVPEDMATDFHLLVVVDVNDGDVGQGFPGVEVEVLAGDHLAQFHDEFGDQGFAGDGRAVFGVAEPVGGFGDFGQGLAHHHGGAGEGVVQALGLLDAPEGGGEVLTDADGRWRGRQGRRR